ncbi:MAG TPA: HesA/MoeB/ThiF family protein [Dehalococcoidia bacterium]|nr:HesA/MoeB/ThiF family protein [Dehalococcoidia bacterium]
MESDTANKDIGRYIAESAESHLAPNGQRLPVISLKTTASIANAQGISAKEVEIIALKQGIVPRRYLRNIGTIGLDGQIKLLQSTVAVIGVGGLGSTVIELLARQGIGHLIIIDNDRFTEQNLNRQIMSTEGNLGEYKVTVAARRIAKINSATTVTTFRKRLTEENAQKLLGSAQIVVDGLDNLPSRLVVEQACRQLAIPYVYASIAGFSGQLMTIFPEDVGLSSLYESSSDTMPEQGIETKIGNPPATPAMIATLQVQEVVKIITGVGTPIRNQILLVDARECAIDRIELGR